MRKGLHKRVNLWVHSPQAWVVKFVLLEGIALFQGSPQHIKSKSSLWLRLAGRFICHASTGTVHQESIFSCKYTKLPLSHVLPKVLSDIHKCEYSHPLDSDAPFFWVNCSLIAWLSKLKNLLCATTDSIVLMLWLGSPVKLNCTVASFHEESIKCNTWVNAILYFSWAKSVHK